jgi:hypothetical protein
VVLDELDKELEERGHRFCRYADDITVFVKSEAAGNRVLLSLDKFISKRLRLKINLKKSYVAPPWDSVILGYSFTKEAQPRLRISPKSMEKLKHKLKPVWRKGRGQSVKMTIAKLNTIIVGWISYYRLAELMWPLKKLDTRFRRRIRWLFLRHWKTPKTTLKKLLRSGVPFHVANPTAYSNAGPWKSSKLPGIQMAYPNKMLKQMGLKSLLDEHHRFAHSM